MQARRFFIGYIFHIWVCFLLTYLYGFYSLKNFLSLLLWYCVISYVLHLLWYKIRGFSRISFLEFFVIFIYKSALLIIFTGLFLWSFFYYQNHISPAKLPVHTLSNGQQTIIFQTMSHIGSEEFYNWVIETIRENKIRGAVLYYEGVWPGSDENSEDFNKAIWIDFTPWLYENFSKLYGVRSQDNNEFLNIENNLDYNIDLNLDQIMDLYKAKTQSEEIKSPPLLANGEVQDLNKDVIERLSSLSQKQLTLLKYINQGLLNFMIKHEWLRNFLVAKLANQDIFTVILEDRNKHLVQELLIRNDEKVIILYGLMHFNWVYDLLKQQDSSWEIINTRYQQIIIQSQ